MPNSWKRPGMAPIPVVNDMRHLAAGAINTWSQVWFQNRNTVPLDVIRIGVGFLIFFNYALIRPHDLIAFYGNNGFLSNAVVPEMTGFTSFSLLMFVWTDWQLLLFHYVFATLCFLYCIGWTTNIVKWLVLIGHLSFINRNPHAWYGVDNVALILMFIMCLAPIGSSLGVDRIGRVARHKIKSGLSMTSKWEPTEPIDVMMPSPTRAMIVSSVAPPISCVRFVRTVTRARIFNSTPFLAIPLSVVLPDRLGPGNR